MNLQEVIQQDLKTALKGGDNETVSVLRMVVSAAKNAELDKKGKLRKQGEEDVEEKGKLTEEEMIEILSHEGKKRKEAAEGFEKGDRKEMAAKEKREFEIISKYLPEQLSEEEISKVVDEVVESLGVSGMQDFGKAMGPVMANLKGKADGNVVGELLKKKLQ